ncbi:MAG TPA: nucleoside-diphosphate sugar epimerase/dehydratase [Gemmatimonadaceae bacterium]|nr:nucleoside-diphosphate sugar epimerase/dehydratase [Gemmatimonadaceae bacterium]
MRNRILLALDILFAVAVVFVSFTARFEGLSWWADYARIAVVYVAVAVPVKTLLYFWVGLYSRLWRYASIADLEIALLACLLGAIASFAIGLGLLPMTGLIWQRVPIGILVMDCALTAATITVPRLLLRVFARRARSRAASSRRRGDLRSNEDARRVLIAGAGDAGGMIAKELLENPQLGLVPIGFIDDDTSKHGHRLHGVRVLGPISLLGDMVHTYSVSEVIIALPSARGKVIREIVQASSLAHVRTRTVPGLYEILSGAKAVSALRPIQIQDLLRRDPIETDLDEVRSFVTGRTVMVTGAGGSIGSELCRQLAQLSPERIVAIGRGENSIFELVEELSATYPNVPVKPAIVDVRDEVRLDAIFREMQPYSVFHAAAHKHVPLMEVSVDEAILNNVLGTRNVAELSAKYAVEHLVLISTDKAVRPTSIMGATKRIAEETLCSVAERTGKRYVSVRFGNVLGSRGSVVPTFMRQIAAGGPITITHPEMRRYFMTIPESVQLVLQAAALGKGGEVFVLDMGEAVKIIDLAEDLIRLSGLEVGHDVEIVFTGTRPGEKLYEELFFGADDATPTTHPKILRARDANPSVEIDGGVNTLIEAARRRESEGELRRMIRYLVPEYCHPSLNGHDATRPVRTRVTPPGAPRTPVEPLVARAR